MIKKDIGRLAVLTTLTEFSARCGITVKEAADLRRQNCEQTHTKMPTTYH